MSREPLTYDDVMKTLTKFPINGNRVDEFFEKEPGLREAFASFAKNYADQIADSFGIELRPRTVDRMRKMFAWCLAVGFLTKDNMMQEDVERIMRRGERGPGC